MDKGLVLITGGAGFIGSHTADELLGAGYRVRLLDSLTPPVHAGDGRWPVWVPADAERVVGDVRSRGDWLHALAGVDAVVHLAAYQDLLPRFAEFFQVNSVGTALLYELIVAHRLPVRKVIVASSQFVCGEGRYRCPGDGEVYPAARDPERLATAQWDPVCPACRGPIAPLPLRETHASPGNPYAISKYSQERLAMTLGPGYGIPSVALRYSIVQGARQSFRSAYSGALRIFTQQMLCGQPATVFEDGRQRRDFVNVADVARANRLVLEREEANFEVFNVGGGQGVTIRDLAESVAATLGRGTVEVTGEYRVGDTRHSVSDVGKLEQLGWRPTKAVGETVQEYLAWIAGQRVDRDYAREALATLRELGALRRSR